MRPSIVRNLSFLLLLAAAPALGAGDPSIRDWGHPGAPGSYVTNDIWVDNNGINGQEPGEPSKGRVNRLFAKVRNLGSTAAADVEVTFAYAPYGLWGWSSYSHFLKILPPVKVDLGAAGSATAERTLEVQWDLSDLTEDNGGAWDNYSVGDFDHFCIWVKIAFPQDAGANNNDARNNFTQVGLALGRSRSLRFMVANPHTDREAQGVFQLSEVPAGFEVDFGELGERFVLEPGEVRLAEMWIHPPAEAPHGLPEARMSLGLEVGGEIIGGITIGVVDARRLNAFPASGGTLSPYLTGTYDLRGKRRTELQLVNPTGLHREVLIALFDADEKPRRCLRETLSPNDLLEIDIKRLLGDGYGVVKVVSRNPADGRPEPGVVGYQRSFARCFWCGDRLAGESPLQAIPMEVLEGDLPIIRKACP